MEPADTAPSLRDGLIEAGIALLNEGGMAALTLRRAAARAGVSHAAPAWHFDGLPGLLTAIAARAFADFSDRMQVARDAAGADPFLRLAGICQGYLDFARINHGLFHVMFASPEVNRNDPGLTPHSKRSYMLLREGCLPFAAAGATEDMVLETAVWSLVHGYATLQFTALPRERQVFGPPPDFPSLLRVLLSGQAGAQADR
jgi:AcrR family transcriptional regulator